MQGTGYVRSSRACGNGLMGLPIDDKRSSVDICFGSQAASMAELALADRTVFRATKEKSSAAP